MTDTSNLQRIEDLVRRLERLGINLDAAAPAPPSPNQLGVTPDPVHVATGELIESAWGNSVVDIIGPVSTLPPVTPPLVGNTDSVKDHLELLRRRQGFYAFNLAETAVNVAPADTQICSYTLTAVDRPGTYLIWWTGQSWTDQTFYIDIYVAAGRVLRTAFEQRGNYESMTTGLATGVNVGDVVRVMASVSGPNPGGIRINSSLSGYLMF